MYSKFLNCLLIACFSTSLISNPTYAQAGTILGLPEPGTMVNLSQAYSPVMIKGLTVHKDNPFLFDFIVDVGEDRLSGEPLKKEGDKLIKYFLASLAIPEKDFWVNLSPYEKDKIVPDALGQTDLGRDLLAQDYILKQITASLIYPEKQLGKSFWDRVYAKAQAKFGTTEIPVNTFNKVWITADRAEVFEHNQTAFVVDSHLKVMLESDYLAQDKNKAQTPTGPVTAPPYKSSGLGKLAPPVYREPVAVPPVDSVTSANMSAQVIREIILPELEKEINTGKNFANLRQIFNSIILSSWYKKNLKQALLNQVYADQSNVKGIDLDDPTIKQKIYDQYLKAYKKGVFNYIKEDVTKSSTLPKKYFSGGVELGAAGRNFAMTSQISKLSRMLKGTVSLVVLYAGLTFNGHDIKAAEPTTPPAATRPATTFSQPLALAQADQAVTTKRNLDHWINSTSSNYRRSLEKFLQEPNRVEAMRLLDATRRNYAAALSVRFNEDSAGALLAFEELTESLRTSSTNTVIDEEKLKLNDVLLTFYKAAASEAMLSTVDPADFVDGTGLTKRLRNMLIGLQAETMIKLLESTFKARKRYEKDLKDPKEELDVNVHSTAIAVSEEYSLNIVPQFNDQGGFLGFDLAKFTLLNRGETPAQSFTLARKTRPAFTDSLRGLWLFSLDHAMSPSIKATPTTEALPGGIDLNTSSGMTWTVKKDGQGVEMTVNPAMIEQVRREGITSLTPVIFKIIPITNIWPLIGLKEPKPHEQLA